METGARFINMEKKNIAMANNEVATDANPNFYLTFNKIWVGKLNFSIDAVSIFLSCWYDYSRFSHNT